jgi:hypothetical protein
MVQAANLTPTLGAGTVALWYRKINQESVVGISKSPSSGNHDSVSISRYGI